MSSSFNKDYQAQGFRLKDFETNSIAEYAAWLETYLGIIPINVSRVWNVRVRSSVPKLLSHKRALVREIEANLEILQTYIDGPDIKDQEKVVAVSVHSQWLYWHGIAVEQVGRLKSTLSCVQLGFVYEDLEEEEDEPPF